MPTKAQADSVTAELRSRSKLPAHVVRVVESLPPDAHPMTQLSVGVMAMQVGGGWGRGGEVVLVGVGVGRVHVLGGGDGGRHGQAGAGGR